MNFYFYSKYSGKSTIEQLSRVTFFVSSSSFHIVCIVISFAFIIHRLYKQTSYYMDALTHASHELIDKSVDYITLPEELYDI